MDEYIAFWLFVFLIEECDVRSIFIDGFPGLKLHVRRTELILQKKYPNIWEIFQKIGLRLKFLW